MSEEKLFRKRHSQRSFRPSDQADLVGLASVTGEARHPVGAVGAAVVVAQAGYHVG
jgi:hypothetical protein